MNAPLRDTPVAGRREPADGGGEALLPSAVNFTIPAPPSTNALFRNVAGKGRVRTKAYDDWRMMGVTAIRRQGIKPFPGRCVITIAVERGSMQSDIDNRAKATLDLLVTAGVLEDDAPVTAIMMSWLPKANGMAHIAIRPVEQFDVTFHPSQNGAAGTWIFHAPTAQEKDDGDKPE